MDIVNIARGLLNTTKTELGIAKDAVEEEALNKYVQCMNCEIINHNHTRCDAYKEGVVVRDYYNEDRKMHYKAGDITHGCNCYLKLKLRSNSQCPLGKF